ncbi:MAG: hypothetical protein AAF572_18460 [Cyanobacteria bacterium P01_B01_bin.77]
MFFGQKQSIPPPPEPDGLEIKIKLSGQTIVKLVSIAVTVLFGSGVLVHAAANLPLANTGPEAVELDPQEPQDSILN